MGWLVVAHTKHDWSYTNSCCIGLFYNTLKLNISIKTLFQWSNLKPKQPLKSLPSLSLCHNSKASWQLSHADWLKSKEVGKCTDSHCPVTWWDSDRCDCPKPRQPQLWGYSAKQNKGSHVEILAIHTKSISYTIQTHKGNSHVCMCVVCKNL